MSKFAEQMQNRNKSAREEALNRVSGITVTTEKLTPDPKLEDIIVVDPAPNEPPVEDPRIETEIKTEPDQKEITDKKPANTRKRKSPADKAAEKQATLVSDEPKAEEEKLEDQHQYAYRPRVHKKERIADTHTSQAYNIENELISIIDDIVGDAWGGKYRFVNEAIKLAIYQEFPQFAGRIRVKE